MIQLIKNDLNSEINSFVSFNAKAYSSLFLYPLIKSSFVAVNSIKNGFEVIEHEGIDYAFDVWTNSLDMFNYDRVNLNINFYFEELVNQFFLKTENIHIQFENIKNEINEKILNEMRELRLTQLSFYDSVVAFDMKIKKGENAESEFLFVIENIEHYKVSIEALMNKLYECAQNLYSLFSFMYENICREINGTQSEIAKTFEIEKDDLLCRRVVNHHTSATWKEMIDFVEEKLSKTKISLAC